MRRSHYALDHERCKVNFAEPAAHGLLDQASFGSTYNLQGNLALGACPWGSATDFTEQITSSKRHGAEKRRAPTVTCGFDR